LLLFFDALFLNKDISVLHGVLAEVVDRAALAFGRVQLRQELANALLANNVLEVDLRLEALDGDCDLIPQLLLLAVPLPAIFIGLPALPEAAAEAAEQDEGRLVPVSLVERHAASELFGEFGAPAVLDCVVQGVAPLEVERLEGVHEVLEGRVVDYKQAQNGHD